MTKMKAAVIYYAGGPDVLKLEERPVPDVKPGWVLVRVTRVSCGGDPAAASKLE